MQPPMEFVAALERMGLADPGTILGGEPLAGGVSSDIWRIDLADGALCVKRALARLKVAADWRVPVERNAYEVKWFRTVGRLLPGAVPRLLGHDPRAGLFAMEFLDPARHPLWKRQLRDGSTDAAFAAAVGGALSAIHAGTAGRAEARRDFASDTLFHALRLEPYLEATARAHADLAGPLLDLAATTARTRLALVHGDISPKNILAGPTGPVFLDAECAWYGDPAFDLAFCLNHLLLKGLWTPAARSGFAACFTALSGAYLASVDWEAPAAIEARAARLLPGLLLARIDGKSPVEYVTDEAEKARVRRVARSLLQRPVERLADVRTAWEKELSR